MHKEIKSLQTILMSFMLQRVNVILCYTWKSVLPESSNLCVCHLFEQIFMQLSMNTESLEAIIALNFQ